MKPSIAVIILTKNEEIHLERAIRSIQSIAQSVHVIDSGSTDATVAIAKQMGCEILSHAWRNHADQFQWGMDHIASSADWILRLDADEIIEPDLAARIASELPALGSDVSGVTFDRKQIFLGRWIRFGGRYPLRLLRLFRRDRAIIEPLWMDEHIVVRDGRIVHFAGGFADHNLNDLSYFTAKHNDYATLEAVQVLRGRYGAEMATTSTGAPLQAAAKRWIKLNLYNRLPFAFAAAAYFLYRYIIRLGFLDGREGLVYHVLQGYWYRFLVGAKTLEFERAIAHCSDPASKLRELSRITGLRLEADPPALPQPRPVAPASSPSAKA